MILDGCVNVQNWQAGVAIEHELQKLNPKLENWVRIIGVMSPAVRVDAVFICMLKVYRSTGLSAVLQVQTFRAACLLFALCFFCEIRCVLCGRALLGMI